MKSTISNGSSRKEQGKSKGGVVYTNMWTDEEKVMSNYLFFVNQIIVVVAFPENQWFDRLFHFLFELLNDENHFSSFNEYKK